MKQYDQSYFDHWYRSRRRIITQPELKRKVQLAVAAAEVVLNREIESVLDVGCGEGAWRAPLLRLRPGIHYVGVDSSEYVVRRFGRRRNIVLGSVGTLHRLDLGRFDLVICADVLAYVSSAELRRGLRTIARLVHGLAYIEAYTSTDEVLGDKIGWHIRSERAYRNAFRQAGLVACGLNCWINRRDRKRLSALERCS